MREPTTTALLAAIGEWEPVLRKFGSRWHDHVPPQVRKELLDIANAMLRLLEFEVPPPSPRRKKS